MTDKTLIDILRAANPDDPNQAMTAREIAAALGIGIDIARDRIREKIEAGEVEVVKIRRLYMNGVINIAYGYRMVVK